MVENTRDVLALNLLIKLLDIHETHHIYDGDLIHSLSLPPVLDVQCPAHRILGDEWREIKLGVTGRGVE